MSFMGTMGKGIAKYITKAGLLGGEVLLKSAAVPGALSAAGVKGNALEQIVNGCTKLVTIVPEHIEHGKLLHRMNGDLDTMTAREFASKHGQVAADTLKIYTDNILEYFGNVGYNFSEQPISTAAAMITTAGLLYFGGEVAKFCRTRGQGGYINRVSRFLGNKVFFGGKNQEPF